MTDSDQIIREKRVWDIPTRLFHWALVLTVCIGWWLGDNLSFDNIRWHFYLGYGTGALVLFRILWGFIGPKPSRLGPLIKSPSAVLAYMKGFFKRKPSHTEGHNPMGGYSVLILLLLLSVQVTTGLFSEADDLFEEGPLAFLVNNEIVTLSNYIHEVCSELLLIMVGIHISVILFYLIWKKENLIRPMLNGMKRVKDDHSS